VATHKRDNENLDRTWLGAETVNSITQTLALILAGALGVYTFVYQERIAPALAPIHPS